MSMPDHFGRNRIKRLHTGHFTQQQAEYATLAEDTSRPPPKLVEWMDEFVTGKRDNVACYCNYRGNGRGWAVLCGDYWTGQWVQYEYREDKPLPSRREVEVRIGVYVEPV